MIQIYRLLTVHDSKDALATMSRIEELPDDFDESLDLNKMSNAGGATDEVDPFDALLDRAIAQGGLTDKTDEQAFADFRKTPLFMTNLADAGDDRMREHAKCCPLRD